MIQNTNFLQTLLKTSGLLSLSKSDCDLFILAQANTITYQQLELSHLHGESQTGGRLSLKKQEKDGYITAKTMPGTNRMKYYILTVKGKKRLEKVFTLAFLSSLDLDLERRPPTSQQQLPHRIRTGDFYFTYLSCPYLLELPRWQLEAGFETQTQKDQLPRCDGLLTTGYGCYFIEQDNCTQGDAALETKIAQYIASDLFLGKNIMNNTLVFTLYASKDKPVKKPPYSVYRILLKAIRVWDSLEREIKNSLTFTEFCAKFQENSSPCLSHLSKSDRNILQNLCYQNPSIGLEEAIQLKKSYLYDTSLITEQRAEQDYIFHKRLTQKFYRLLEVRNNATLLHRLRKGMHLFVIPNHQLENHLPFLLQKEYHIPELLPQLLFHLGLQDLEAWKFSPSGHFTEPDGEFFFYNIFTNIHAEQCCIIFEDVTHDLGGRERIRYYLRTHKQQTSTLFVLYVSDKNDADIFFSSEQASLRRYENTNVSICFIYKSAELFKGPNAQCTYSYIDQEYKPVLIDFDDFSNELHLQERPVMRYDK